MNDPIPIHEGRPTVVDLQLKEADEIELTEEQKVLQRQAYEQAVTEHLRAESAGEAEWTSPTEREMAEGRYAPAGTQAGGPKPRVDEPEEDELPQVDFDDLSDKEKWDVTQQAIAVLLARSQELELHVTKLQQQVQVVAGSLVRILEKAGEIDLPPDSGLILPEHVRKPGQGRLAVPK